MLSREARLDQAQTPASRGLVPADQLSVYLAALRARWWIVAWMTAMAGVAAFVLSSSSPKKYDAAAKLTIDSTQPADVVLDTSLTRSPDSEREINTSVALVKLEKIANRVEQRLGLRIPASQLLRQVRVGTQGNSNVVVINARDGVPERAAAIANAFAREYVAFRRSSARAAYHEAAQVAQRELDSLSPSEREGPQGRELDQRVTELRIAATLQTGGVQLVDAADVPTSPAAPRPKLNTAIGAFLGLLLGSLLAIVVTLGDRRLNDEDDVESLISLPVLTKIPNRRRNVGPATAGWRVEAEAYATLAVNLRLLALGEDLRTIMFVSGNEGAWKTSATLGAGKALASMGHRVIAIEADLRQPRFAEYLGFEPGGGIERLFAKESSLEDELVEIDLRTGVASGRETVPPHDGSFAVLPAGRALADPHRLLSSNQMRETLAAAHRQADVLLVDTPSIGSVSDALSLGSVVDTSVFVVRLKHSTREATRRTLQALTRVGIDVAGIVISGVSGTRAAYWYMSDEQAREDGERRHSAAFLRRLTDRQRNEDTNHGRDAERVEAGEVHVDEQQRQQ